GLGTRLPDLPRWRGRTLGEHVGQVQRDQHGDALAGLELAAVADGAHLAVDLGDGFLEPFFAAIWAAQQVALAHDGHFDLLHACRVSSAGESWPSSGSAGGTAEVGSLSIRASMRARAADRRALRESRSWPVTRSCC